MSSSRPTHTISLAIFAVAFMASAAITGIAPSYAKDPGGEELAPLESSPLKHGAQLYDN